MTLRGGRSAPDQGTLIALVRAKERGPRTLALALAQIRRTHQLSASYVGVGFVTIGAILLVRGFFSFAWSLSTGSLSWVTAVGWALVVAAFLAGTGYALGHRGELPRHGFVAVLLVDVAALGLELAAYSATSDDTFFYPSVCVGVGATLLALVSFHPLSRTCAGIACLLVAGGATVVVQGIDAPAGIGVGVTLLLLALAPVAAAAALLSTVDQHVHRKLDRTITDSMINAPGTGVGRVASGELSRVDGRIEELLDRVTRLPESAELDAELAEHARELGDELRQALARSHDRSWLQIAVEEATHLSDAITVVDPGLLAAVLLPPDRARLLSILWLLTAPGALVQPTRLVVGTPSLQGDPSDGSGLVLELRTGGRVPRDLDPAVWGILSELGHYRVGSLEGDTIIHLDHPVSRRSTR